MPATIFYTGLAPVTRWLERITIGSAVASAYYTATINGKNATYRALASGETTTTIAAGLIAAIQASQDGEFRELASLATSSGATIDLTGVADGAPFTLTTSATGGATISNATITTSTGPRHLSDLRNYTAGGLATAANQLDQIAMNIASTGGNLRLTVPKLDGTFGTTANAAWNAIDATYLAAIQAQLDTTTGVVNGILVSAIPATDTDMGIRLAYSGTGYAGKVWTPAVVATFPTSSTAATYSSSAIAPGDNLIWADAVHGPQYDTGCLAGTALANVTRRSGHTGRFGLPAVSANGYREYRPTELQLNVTGTIRLETNDTDSAEQLKVRDVTGGANTVIVTGVQQGDLGSEIIEIQGLTGSALNGSKGSLAIAKRQGQTCSLGAVSLLGMAYTSGEGATAGAVKASGGAALIKGNLATLATDRGAQVEVAEAAAITGAGITIDGGTVVWSSSGDPIAVTIGSGGTFDLSSAVIAIPSTDITLNEGGVLNDPEAKNGRPYNVVLNRTDLAGVTLNVGTNRTLAVS